MMTMSPTEALWPAAPKTLISRDPFSPLRT